MNDNFLSRVEDILTSMINSGEYTDVPQSRVEALLLRLKENIDELVRKGPFYPAGNIDFDELPDPSEETLGAMYNINDAFITNNKFVEGAGVEYQAGTNVAVVNTGTKDDPVYMFDAYSGSYVTDSSLSDTSENPVQNKVVKSALDGKASTNDLSALAAIVANKANSADLASVATSGAYSDLSGTPNLAEVATSGAYSDLSGTPNLSAVATSGAYSDLSGTPTIPTKTSDLQNDSGFVTSQIDDATASSSKTYSSSKIDEKLSGKVDIVQGKGLSTNDYDNTEKAAVATIANKTEINDTTPSASTTYSGNKVEEIASNLADNTAISSTTTGINPSITDSTDANVQGLTVYGRSEVVEGDIESIGDSGSLDVQTCGKNLFDGIVEPGTIDSSTGENIYQANRYRSKNYIKVKPNTEYVFSYNGAAQIASWVGYTANKTFVPQSWITENHIQTGENTEYVRFFYDDSVNKQAGLQLELGSTATAYEPYVSTSAAITTGVPLYAVGDVKDELDEKKGVVVKRTKGGKVSDTSLWEWAKSDLSNQGRTVFVAIVSDAKYPESMEIPMSLLATTFTVVAQSDSWLPTSMSCRSNYSQIVLIVPPTISNVTELLALYGDEEIYYCLAEPVELPLTPAEKSALLNLKTFDSTTNVTITDDPFVDFGYLKNTENGKAVAENTQNIINRVPFIGSSWIANIPEMHRNIFRGQSLGSSVTAAQLAAIDDGSFDDLYVGDYWTINSTVYRIADMDRYYGIGDTALAKHHLVIVPDEPLNSVKQMNNGLYSTGALRTTGLTDAKSTINTDFPDMVLTYRNFFEAYSSTSDDWKNADIEIMSQSMVFGNWVQSYTTGYLPHRVDVTPLALFALAPKFIVTSTDYWLRDQDQRNARYLFVVMSNGLIADNEASLVEAGVRPFFLLGDAS